MENNKIEVIKMDAIIKIELSGSFYKNLQAVLFHLASYRESEEVTALIQKMNEQSESAVYDEWETSMETLMILCAEVEEKAKEQKCTEEIEIPSQEDTSEETTVKNPSL